MGMFDSVIFPCPTCGEEVEAQSKAGECYMNRYSIDNAPPEIAVDVAKDKYEYCEKCHERCRIELETRPVLKVFADSDGGAENRRRRAEERAKEIRSLFAQTDGDNNERD